MFRAEIRWLAEGPVLRIEGKLAGHWAEQAMDMVTKDIVPKGLIVDLTEVGYVDSEGGHLLRWLASIGAVFVARSTYAIAACERLRLSRIQSKAERHKERHGKNDERPSIRYPIQLRRSEAQEKEESHVLVSLDDKRSRCP